MYGNKKKTLREISKNPENMTEEERKDMAELFASLKEVGKACEPYDIKTIRKNTVNTLSKRFYQEHFIMSAVLESYFVKNEISFKELNETIVNYIPKEFTWNISVARINLIISKMIRLGLVEPIETDNKYAPNFKITDDGVKAYQAHTFQSLATSSFFNYQTYRMSILMMIVTIISVLVAILSIIVTIYVTNK